MLSLVLVLTACTGAPERTPAEHAPPGPPAPEASAEEQALERTEAAAKQLGKTLKGAVVTALEEQGPAGAVDMCHGQADPLTEGVAEETGVAVGRASLRLRNPDNTGPDWVMAWLEDQDERKAEGVQGIRTVVDGQARVLKPIPVEGACLTCHGTAEQIPDDVEAILAERYPDDQATGYAPGDLRGGLWAVSEVR